LLFLVFYRNYIYQSPHSKDTTQLQIQLLRAKRRPNLNKYFYRMNFPSIAKIENTDIPAAYMTIVSLKLNCRQIQ